MSDVIDLKKWLDGWPYDPENDMRLVKGEDGRPLLQVRTLVGIEQMEMDGRPDGTRPHNRESILDYYQDRLKQAFDQGQEKAFKLDPNECNELFNEGTLYYFRYVRLFQLKDWARTIRDTARNLRAFDFVHRYAEREEDQLFLEKWRPYILRVNASANALMELDQRAFDKALEVTEEAIAKVEALEDLEDETFRFEKERSLMALRELAGQIRKNRPVSELEQLERQLRRAIDRQEFERAAVLRDRIRALKKS